MYGGKIDGTTTTVDIKLMTALKRNGSSLIPASLVNVLKGIYVRIRTYDVHFILHVAVHFLKLHQLKFAYA